MILKIPLDKIVGYIVQQIRGIQGGGPSVFFKKLKVLFFIVLSLPIIILIRLLRPLIIIRFGLLVGQRIGHFAGNTELYLCERDAGIQGDNIYDFFFVPGPVCNEQLEKMWKRALPISKYVGYLYRANHCLPGYKSHLVSTHSDRDVHNLISQTRPHVSFTEAEEQIGQQGLKAMGLPEGMPFFCFIGRDPAYLEASFPGDNCDHHNYRDMDIKAFVPTVQALIQKGYFGIRMGCVVQAPLHFEDARYVDYATKHRTNFLDMYLSEKCHFFVNGMSGLDAVPMFVFRRPTVQVNSVPIECMHFSCMNALYIFKKLWLTQEHRFLTFSEILQSRAGRMLRTEQYKDAGIKLIDNTSDEICAVALEMESRIQGTWETTGEEEDLQNRFRQILQCNGFNTVFNARVGADFLSQNQELLN